jgi:2-desacetyl-2-hydroxyethyl bacteriochlorophyllide A dehydrogenase
MADHVAFEEEVMRDPLGVAVHAVKRSHFPEGATVLCIGGGPVGLLTAQVARAKGAGQVFVSETSPIARQVIARYADFTCVDPTEHDLGDVVGRARCAAIFDTVGTAATTREALPLLAEVGTYVNVAVHDVALTLNALDLASERVMTSSANALYRDEREAHDLLASGDVAVQAMITHRFPLSDFADAYDLLLASPKQAYKVVFEI